MMSKYEAKKPFSPNPPGGQEGSKTESLPEIKFWENKEEKIVNRDLFSDVAMKCAEVIRKKGGRNKNTISQIRRFYDEVNLLYDRLIHEKNPKDNFKRYLPYVKMLNAKVFYARGRGHIITDDVVKFIGSCVSNVEDFEDFRVFREFFEAFIGFYKFFDER